MMGPLPRAARGGRPGFHADPAIDRLIQIVMTLGSEVSVLADRLATVESLAGVPAEAVDAFEPDAQTRARREAAREALLERILAPLLTELEALDAGDTRDGYWERIRRIEEGED